MAQASQESCTTTTHHRTLCAEYSTKDRWIRAYDVALQKHTTTGQWFLLVDNFLFLKARPCLSHVHVTKNTPLLETEKPQRRETKKEKAIIDHKSGSDRTKPPIRTDREACLLYTMRDSARRWWYIITRGEGGGEKEEEEKKRLVIAAISASSNQCGKKKTSGELTS